MAGTVRRGLTLAELLVVATIMIMLMGLLVHGLAPVRRQQYVIEAANATAGMIRLARSMAISQNAIYHVRVLNRSATDQQIGIWWFPKVTDALDAETEDKVIEQGGWNPNAFIHPSTKNPKPNQNPATGKDWTNYRADAKKIEGGAWFETFGDLDPLQLPMAVDMKKADYSALSSEDRKKVDAWRDRLAGRTRTGKSSDNYSYLYYDNDPDGRLGPLGPDDAGNPKKRLGKSLSSTEYRHVNVLPRDPTGTSRLLFFRPDGSASAGVAFCVREGDHYRTVTVTRSGAIGIGDQFVP